MKSIMKTEKGICYICSMIGQTEEHHIFGGANRRWSEKHGLKVNLCIECHRTGKESVHSNINTNRSLQRQGQQEFEKSSSRKEFMKIFGRNYL